MIWNMFVLSDLLLGLAHLRYQRGSVRPRYQKTRNRVEGKTIHTHTHTHTHTLKYLNAKRNNIA